MFHSKMWADQQNKRNSTHPRQQSKYIMIAIWSRPYMGQDNLNKK